MELGNCAAFLIGFLVGLPTIGLMVWGLTAHFALVKKMDWRNQITRHSMLVCFLFAFLWGSSAIYQNTTIVDCGEGDIAKLFNDTPVQILLADCGCPCGCGGK